jgi:hypothetical protein
VRFATALTLSLACAWAFRFFDLGLLLLLPPAIRSFCSRDTHTGTSSIEVEVEGRRPQIAGLCWERDDLRLGAASAAYQRLPRAA